MQLESIQRELQRAGLDGWLFSDHHLHDPLAYRVLSLPMTGHVTRRWYYFIPARGEPRALVHGARQASPAKKPTGLRQEKGLN
jgi:hypothetical protein